MSWTKEFVQLDKSIHDRTAFDCGVSELNAFLQTNAAKHMEVGVSRTLVLPATVPLLGKIAKKLPHYPVPVFLLAQLAVHLEYHGKGLGKITLIKALDYFWKINSYIKAYAGLLIVSIKKQSNFI